MNDSTDSQAIIDTEHLRLLSIFHYVAGGLHAAFSCILIFHVVFGLLMAVAPHVVGGNGQGAPPTFVGLFMSGAAGFLMLLGWLFGGLTIYSGVCIKKRRNRIFSLVIAVINCLSVPLGTVLGVFTLVVLSRASVKERYKTSGSGLLAS